MCEITRRDLLTSGAAVFGLSALEEEAIASPTLDINKVDPLSTDVYFHEGDLAGKGHCNNGWIIFEDYVLVIDANFPSGANEIIPKIRALTEKPIRFAFDTHHHGDHAYGNQVWVDNGATPVAHTGVVEEMKRYETGYYDGRPGRWEDTAKSREDVKNSKLKPPSVLFPKELIFDDRKRRVELIHLGIAHTHGDAWAFLPKERILFSGDACVNGPYNFVGDGSVEKWIGTLAAAKKLGAKTLCPGHGPRGTYNVLDDQQAYFSGLRDSVGLLVHAKKSAKEIKAAIPRIKTQLQANAQIKRYIGDFFPVQVEKVYTEMTGQKLPAAPKTALHARAWHAHQHGHVHV
jgi:cyclase